MARDSVITYPFGYVIKDDNKEIIFAEINLTEISNMKKYIDIGLSLGIYI